MFSGFFWKVSEVWAFIHISNNEGSVMTSLFFSLLLLYKFWLFPYSFFVYLSSQHSSVITNGSQILSLFHHAPDRLIFAAVVAVLC